MMETLLRRTAAVTVALALSAAQPGLLPAQSSVAGVVRDSLTGRSFANALVELVPIDRPWRAGFSTRADSAGRFVIADVEPGTYHFGFQHPRLDSLGMDPILRTLEVSASRRRLTADLALPTGRTFARTLCGELGQNSGVLVGRVIDARDGRTPPAARCGHAGVNSTSAGNPSASRSGNAREP